MDKDKELIQKVCSFVDISSTVVEGLAFIALMRESDIARDIVNDMDYGDLHMLIPSLTKEEYSDYYDILELLIDHDKLGFIAKCEFTIPKEFSFDKDGNFKSCYNSCHTYPYYVYAESIDELVNKIMEKDKELFKREENAARKAQGIAVKS